MKNDIYREWADEIIQSMLEKYSDPFREGNYDKAVNGLAEKLKSDLEDCIVYEWFCADCDYSRRYGN